MSARWLTTRPDSAIGVAADPSRRARSISPATRASRLRAPNAAERRWLRITRVFRRSRSLSGAVVGHHWRTTAGSVAGVCARAARLLPRQPLSTVAAAADAHDDRPPRGRLRRRQPSANPQDRRAPRGPNEPATRGGRQSGRCVARPSNSVGRSTHRHAILSHSTRKMLPS